MKKVILDCDMTMGVNGCDVDDGLAMMYLLGSPEVEFMGLTATYGNNRLDVVVKTMETVLSEIKRPDIIVKKGGAKAGEYDSEAAEFLAEMANRYPGEISILATGSLTNLRGAYEKDNTFFDKIKEIVLMGGITETLVFEKNIMDELNFSCDPLAAYTVLTKGKNVSTMTGNNCLKVLFTRAEYQQFFRSGNPAAEYIRWKTDYWFDNNDDDYGIKGFYNWDVTSAVYLVHPEIFSDHKEKLLVSEEDLKRGYLRKDEVGNCICNLPEIEKEQEFRETIYNTWMNVPM